MDTHKFDNEYKNDKKTNKKYININSESFAEQNKTKPAQTQSNTLIIYYNIKNFNIYHRYSS